MNFDKVSLSLSLSLSLAPKVPETAPVVFRYSFGVSIMLAEGGASEGDQEGPELSHCVYKQPTPRSNESNLIFDNLSLTHAHGREWDCEFSMDRPCL